MTFDYYNFLSNRNDKHMFKINMSILNDNIATTVYRGSFLFCLSLPNTVFDYMAHVTPWHFPGQKRNLDLNNSGSPGSKIKALIATLATQEVPCLFISE